MLKQRLEEVRFQEMQTRRVSTEARIAILTNDYVGTPLRSKGFKNRNTRIECCILTHNFWKIAAMAVARWREMVLLNSALSAEEAAPRIDSKKNHASALGAS